MATAPRFRNPIITASYRSAVEWIALNDEPTILDGDEIERQLTVAMLADLCFTSPARVAIDVVRIRRSALAELELS